jgi:4-carboxymuconolactone decarboxylase
MSRPPELDETQLSPEQQSIFDAIRSGPRGVVEGPLRVWLQSAALAEPAQKLGAFCRYGTKLPSRLSELAIITVGAHWRSGFEWHVHAPIAAAAGIDAEAIAVIKAGQKPKLTQQDEIVIYDFTRELLTTHHVSNVTYELAIGLFGLEATVELVGVLGYYTLICMTINAFHVPVPPGSAEPFV